MSTPPTRVMSQSELFEWKDILNLECGQNKTTHTSLKSSSSQHGWVVWLGSSWKEYSIMPFLRLVFHAGKLSGVMCVAPWHIATAGISSA